MRGGIYENRFGRGARWVVRFPGGVLKRFADRGEAERFITGLRFKKDEGIFDPRDYQKDNPLGLETLASEFLTKRKLDGLKCPRALRFRLGKAVEYFGNRNIKTINNREVEKFRSWLLLHEEWSSKYKACILTTLHTFLKWVAHVENGENGFKMPEFEAIDFEMKMRNILDKDTQLAVLEEVKRLTWHLNPKIYIACLWLSTYVTARPIELLSIVESDIDADAGVIRLRRNKEGRDDKRIYLLEEDVAYLKTLPKALHPDTTFFFRHSQVREGLQKKFLGRQFGTKLLYNWWEKASANLGVDGVSIYPGTRHSSVSDLGKYYSPEEVMDDGTGHTTSKSFLRYFHVRAEKKRAVSATARRCEHLVNMGKTLTAKANLPK